MGFYMCVKIDWYFREINFDSRFYLILFDFVYFVEQQRENEDDVDDDDEREDVRKKSHQIDRILKNKI